MTYNLVILPGDGIGREVMAQGRAVLEAVADRFGIALDIREFPCGGRYYQETGEEWPSGTFELCRDWSDAILLGAMGWPGVTLPTGFNAGHGVIFGLRFGLDLYANVRPVRLLPGVKHRFSGNFETLWTPGDVDLVIVRENTEGLYAHTCEPGLATRATGEGRANRTDRVVDERLITTRGSERIARYAFELAHHRARSKVTCVDKSNVLAGCRLFRSCFDRVGLEYPDIEQDHAYIDAFCQSLMREPERYDVVVTTNLFGDIATDLAAVLQGGMGLAASANLGQAHALFEPVHGSAPDQAGQDTANTTAMILSVAMMLDHWATARDDRDAAGAARAIEEALLAILARGDGLTPDLGGSTGCSRFGQAVVRELTCG